MRMTINAGLTDAWYKGMAELGISPSEYTEEEKFALQKEIQRNFTYIEKFADAIDRNSKANKGKLTPLLERSKLWANRYNMVKQIAKSNASTNPKLQWVLGATKEHCVDALKLESKVYRASIWKKHDIYPQHNDLACGGYKCKCRFVPVTDLPVVPGFPPKLSGQIKKDINDNNTTL